MGLTQFSVVPGFVRPDVVWAGWVGLGLESMEAGQWVLLELLFVLGHSDTAPFLRAPSRVRQSKLVESPVVSAPCGLLICLERTLPCENDQ